MGLCPSIPVHSSMARFVLRSLVQSPYLPHSLSPNVLADLLLEQLRNGLLISLPPRLIRRLKSHFHHLPPPCGPTGVDIILGLNGYVWVSSGTTTERREGGEGFDAEAVYSDKNDVLPSLASVDEWTLMGYEQEISPESREAISMVGNIVRMLAGHGVPLTDALLGDAYDWVVVSGIKGRPLSGDEGERMVVAVTGMDVQSAL